MAEQLVLRIGTVERERAAELLAEHLRAGRLEIDEYDERVQQVYAARTAADLQPLFADLPGELAVHPAQPPRQRPPLPARMVWLVLTLLALGVAFAVITSHPPIFLVLVVLLVLRLRGGRHRYWAHR